jgi:hypothetical protein
MPAIALGWATISLSIFTPAPVNRVRKSNPGAVFISSATVSKL